MRLIRIIIGLALWISGNNSWAQSTQLNRQNKKSAIQSSKKEGKSDGTSAGINQGGMDFNLPTAKVKKDPKQQFSATFTNDGGRRGYQWVGPAEHIGVSKAMYRSDLLNNHIKPGLTDSMDQFWDSLITPWERSGGRSTASYQECVNWYSTLARLFPGWLSFGSIGVGDNGLPIYAVTYSTQDRFKLNRFGQPLNATVVDGNSASIENNSPLSAGGSSTELESKPLTLLINNNIHPGEPEGTDASMLLLRDMVFFPDQYYNPYLIKPLDLRITVICQYNVDGTANRGRPSRANQVGPDAYGFRGNARNLDLNRDFIKLDSRNAEALVRFMASRKFDFFIDNHTSNGADYQYVLTYFHTRPEKLYHPRKQWIEPFELELQKRLKADNWKTAPYVETLKTIPDSGLYAFWETGRYATGYAALIGTVGYTVETHMLKPFPQRVLATLAFMENFVENLGWVVIPDVNSGMGLTGVYDYKTSGKLNRLSADYFKKPGTWMPLNFQLDKSQFEYIDFYGYQSGYKKSEVTGMPRLYYDRSKPWQGKVKYFNRYVPVDSVLVPMAYIVSAAYPEIVDMLKRNDVYVKRNSVDTVLNLRVSYILDYKTVNRPYESHYLHYDIHVRDTIIPMKISAGDYIIPLRKETYALLVNVLEPQAPDSYFAWNYFDGILQQKEGFSDYVFEDYAADWLNKNPNKKNEFESMKKQDEAFAKNAWAQLQWIYQQTELYEPTHNRYPVYRLDKN